MLGVVWYVVYACGCVVYDLCDIVHLLCCAVLWTIYGVLRGRCMVRGGVWYVGICCMYWVSSVVCGMVCVAVCVLLCIILCVVCTVCVACMQSRVVCDVRPMFGM